MLWQLYYFLFYVKLMFGESATYFYTKGGRGYPAHMITYHTLGIDIGSTTVKIAVLNEDHDAIMTGGMSVDEGIAQMNEKVSAILAK